MKYILHAIFFLIVSNCFAQSANVMTYNIRYENLHDEKDLWEKRKKKVLDMIEYYNPAILGIQEGLHRQVHFLDNNLEKYHYVGIGRDDGKKAGEYAAIFYNHERFEVVESSTFWLSPTPDSITVGWDAALERICTYARFKEKSTGKELWVFNTHFDHEGKRAQLNSAKLIAKTIEEKTKESDIPVILMGDLNVTPNQKPIKVLNKSLEDAFDISQKPHYGPNSTFNGFKTEYTLNKRIDYIFVKNIQVLRHIHIDDRLDNSRFPSDHWPVLIEANF